MPSADYPDRLIISVIIPVFNGQETIERQLNSLRHQTFSGTYEVIVSDNGSTDDTRRIVQENIKNFPATLRIIDSSDHRGASHARNMAVKAAKASLIAMCDADDVTDENWLAAAVESLQDNEVCVGRIIEISKNHFGKLNDNHRQHYFTDSKRPTFLSGNMAIRTATYWKVGGFDESMPVYGGEDSEFGIRLMELGIRTAYNPQMVIGFSPESSLPRLIRKIFLASQAEILIWHKHPDLFRSQLQKSRFELLLESTLVAMRHLRDRNFRSGARAVIRGIAQVSTSHSQILNSTNPILLSKSI